MNLLMCTAMPSRHLRELWLPQGSVRPQPRILGSRSAYSPCWGLHHFIRCATCDPATVDIPPYGPKDWEWPKP